MTMIWVERRTARIDRLSTGHSLSVDALRGLVHNPAAIIGAGILGAFTLLALLAPLLAPHGAAEVIPQLQRELRVDVIPGPRAGFLLGSDQLGRDFLSRMLMAARQTLVIGAAATALALVLGTAVGAAAGACGGWADALLMRSTDALLAIPGLLLAVAIALLAARPSAATVIVAVGLVGVPVFARLMRGALVAQRTSDHVLAATTRGIPVGALVVRHVLPGALGPVFVQVPLTAAAVLLDVAALSFLGLGDTDPGRAEWGSMLAQAQSYLDVRPALAVGPAVAIILVALGCTLLGESLRAALDTRGRR